MSEIPKSPDIYDTGAVEGITDYKVRDIIARTDYAITGFVLTDKRGRRCVVNSGAVRWWDDPKEFFRMMHPDADALDAKDERIEELEGALRTLVISAASLDNAFTLGCRFRDKERYPEIACGLVNLRTFIERARAALKGE